MQQLAAAAGLAVVAVGAVVLAGWALGLPRLTQMAPGLATMKANTALAVAGCGVALFVKADRRRRRPGWNRVAVGLAWLAVAVAAGTLFEAATGANLGIDQLVFRDATIPPPGHPGRPSVGTATCLLLVGSALLVLDRATAGSQVLATLAAAVSGLALLGYAYGIQALYRVVPYSSIALHTAVALATLSVGVLLARPLRCLPDLFVRQSRGGGLARRLLPATVGVPLVAGWACLAGYRGRWYPVEFAFALFSLGCVAAFFALVWSNVSALDRSDGRERQMARDRDGLLVRERAARALAERAVAARDQLLSVVSHELRTPLTPVLLVAAELARQDDLPAGIRDDLAMICDQVQAEGRLIDDLLDLVSLRQAKLAVTRERLDGAALVHATVAVFAGPFAEKGVALDGQWEPPRGDAATAIVGDAGRVQQVVRNLLANALKFTDAGGTVTVRCRAEAGQFCVDVADTGVGIAAEAMGRIFDDFEQADPSTTRRYGGLGVGLSISRRLAELHGGTLTAVSDGPAHGARFTLCLPLAPEPATPDAQPSPAPAPPAQAVPGRRILIVEDNPLTLRLLSRLLGSRGHAVTTVTSAREALAAVGTDPPCPFDLLISDIGLPDVDGWELMRQVRGRHPIPGIALSGFVADADRHRSLASGYAHHLGKPVDVPKLVRTIGQLTAEPATAMAG